MAKTSRNDTIHARAIVVVVFMVSLVKISFIVLNVVSSYQVVGFENDMGKTGMVFKNTI